MALNYDCPKLKSILVWSFHVYEKSWPSAIIDAWFIMWSWLSLFVATSRLVVMQAGFACGWLLTISNTLFRCRHRLHLLGWRHCCLWQTWGLLLLIWEAFIIPCFELLVQPFDWGEWHSSHELKLSWINDIDFQISTRESNDCACKVDLVHKEETFFLNTKICEELCISADILSVLGWDLSA